MAKEAKDTEKLVGITELPSKVTTALLHAGTMLPAGAGTETTLSDHRVKGIKMNWVPKEGLLIEVKGKKALIPPASLKIVHFE